MNKPITLPEESLFKKIYLIRDQKILLDADLAFLYGVETRALKQAVRRNIDRFPEDFMFELSREEWKTLRSQIVILEGSSDPKNLRSQFVTSSWGGMRYQPMAFTEQGVAMLSSVLNSPRAIAINIQIMRIFVKMRQMITSYKDLLEKIEKLEASDLEQNKQIRNIYNLIKELLEPAVKSRKPIGFRIKSKNDHD